MLQLFNACQFLSGMFLATATGLDGRDYDDLGSSKPVAPLTGAPAVSGAWQEVIDQAGTPLKAGLAALAKRGVVLPEVGPELADGKGRVVADAELRWAEQRVILLRPDQSDLAEIWQAQQWAAFLLDDGLTLIEGLAWESVIAAALGLTNDEE